MRGTALALLASGIMCAACATVSGLDGLNEVDGLGDASIDQSAQTGDDGSSGGTDGGVNATNDSGGSNGDAGKVIKDGGKDTGPLAPIPSINCGAGKCSDAGQICCWNRLINKNSTCDDIDSGAAAACTPVMNRDPLYCDDKADCPQAKPFCCFANGTASCETEANCNAGNGRFLCSTLADCPDASVNCVSAPGVFNLVICK